MRPNKTNQTTKNPVQHDMSGKHNRPENKDDMDSRKNEEYILKGDDYYTQ